MESGDRTTSNCCKQYREQILHSVSVVNRKSGKCREAAIKGRMSYDNTKSCYCQHRVQQEGA